MRDVGIAPSTASQWLSILEASGQVVLLEPFVVEVGGRMELFEAKWTELPSPAEAVNPDFVRRVAGGARVVGGSIVCRAPNGYPPSRQSRCCP